VEATVSLLAALDPSALRARATGRSWWLVRYRDGRVISEWTRRDSMAIQPQEIGSFNDGRGIVEYTYDTITHKVQAIVLTNNGLPGDLTMTAYQADGVTVARSWTGTVNSGVTTFNVPQQGANSITLTQTPKGYWVLPFVYGIQS
jgi:hypothetical protein